MCFQRTSKSIYVTVSGVLEPVLTMLEAKRPNKSIALPLSHNANRFNSMSFSIFLILFLLKILCDVWQILGVWIVLEVKKLESCVARRNYLISVFDCSGLYFKRRLCLRLFQSRAKVEDPEHAKLKDKAKLVSLKVIYVLNNIQGIHFETLRCHIAVCPVAVSNLSCYSFLFYRANYEFNWKAWKTERRQFFKCWKTVGQ